MADEPVTLSVLAQFHRDVILPDMERMVRGIVEPLVADLRGEMAGHFDALYKRIETLETEYQMLVAGLRRIEETLQVLAEGQQKLALKSDLEALRGRVDALQQQIRTIEARLA